MTGKVIKISDFRIEDEWLFLINSSSENYYIMNSSFYEQHHLKIPVTKREIDNLIEKMDIDFEFISIDDQNIITKINKWPLNPEIIED